MNLRQRWLGWKIKHGLAPHGRTGVEAPTWTPAFTGGPTVGGVDVGGAVLRVYTKLTAEHFRNGEKIDERVVLNRVVTDAGRDAIVDAFTNTFELETFNYHHCGTGVGNEAVGDTALGTPVAEARVAGTQTQPSSDVYQTVATITFSNPYAITEHGLFSAAAAGTLLDRTKFVAINVVATDSIAFTFTLTIASGG